MMRITEIEGDGTVARLQVEGHITRETVRDLRASSDARLGERRALLLDLSGVRFVDPEGVRVLRELVPKGTELIGCSGFLDELLRGASCPPSRTPVTDEQLGESLLARLRRGDEAAFEELIRTYGGRMLAAARRLLRSEDDARDAVQEAFLAVFNSIGTFQGESRLSTWLHRIAVNAALMKLRRRKPEESIDELLPRFDQQGEWAGGTASTLPGDLLEQNETRRAVRRCIDRLPETYRTVLLLRDIEELDTEETADVLNVSPNAVKVRLHRARQALRTLLEREMGDLLPAHPSAAG